MRTLKVIDNRQKARNEDEARKKFHEKRMQLFEDKISD